MFPDNYAVLVVGDPTAGMFEFSCYLTSTYLKNEEKVVFVETNTHPDQVRRQIGMYGLDASELEQKGAFVIVDCYSSSTSSSPDLSALRVTDVANLPEIGEKVSEGIAKVGGRPVRVLLDCLTPLYMHHESREVGLFFRGLASLVRVNGTLTAAVHRGMLHEDQIALLESVADGMIELMVDSDFKRYVRIKYLRGMAISPRWVPFEFEREEEEAEGAFLGWGRD